MKDEYVFNQGEFLGGGAFGQVYGGICRANNKPVAIKVIDKTPFINPKSETTVFHSEITLLSNIDHPGVIKMFSIFEEQNNVCFNFIFNFQIGYRNKMQLLLQNLFYTN
jgi:serine/threonine protein kinase